MNKQRQLSVKEIAELVDGTVIGDGTKKVFGINDIEHAQEGQITFFRDRKYLKFLEATKAAAILVPDQVDDKLLQGKTFIKVSNPVLAFAKTTMCFMEAPVHHKGIDQKAAIAPTAKVDPSATIYPFVSIGENSVVGANAVLYPGVFIDKDVTIGDDCTFYANVSVMHGSVIENRVILHAGAVIGADGFGYTPNEETGRPFKIPQLGRVRLEDDVEIGANSTVDRATVDWTILQKGTKLDNLVQIGHNCNIGENAIICSQVGISGSVTVGKNVLMAGQVGTYSHVKIGDNVTVTARGGISKDIAPDQTIKGYPPMPIKDYLNLQAHIQKLPQLRDRIAELERTIASLREERVSELPH